MMVVIKSASSYVSFAEQLNETGYKYWDMWSIQPSIRGWPWREPDHSPPNSNEVKNVWSYTSTPAYVFMVWYFIKHQK
jgi:hypothetical protein